MAWHPNPTMLFNKIFRKKAHPELEFNDKIKEIKEAQLDMERVLLAHILHLQDYFKASEIEINKKLDIILDIKNLKDKVNAL